MDDRDRNDVDEARQRARERLAARQGRMASEERGRSAGSQRRRSQDHDARFDEAVPRSLRNHVNAKEADAGERREKGADAVGFFGQIGSAVTGFFATLGLRRIAILAAIVLALILLAFGISSCMRSCSPDQAGEGQMPQAEVGNQGETGDGTVSMPTLESLPEGLDPDLAANLVEAAATNQDVAWIANHAADYAVDGDMVQYKLLKLATEEPEAVGFVRAFPETYPTEAADSFSDTVEKVPNLYQWDRRWGYTVYSSTTFALTGCCPTALSMVYMGLTGKTDISPYDMGVRAANGGYMTQYDGTDGSFLVNEAPSLGLACSEVGVSADALREALGSGNVVICNVGPGDFTTGGHYFVITKLNDDGTVSVNDPYSATRSAKTWDVDQIIGQTKVLYSYSLA